MFLFQKMFFFVLEEGCCLEDLQDLKRPQLDVLIFGRPDA